MIIYGIIRFEIGDVLDSTGAHFIIWQAKNGFLLPSKGENRPKNITGKIKNAFAQAFDFSANPAILGIAA